VTLTLRLKNVLGSVTAFLVNDPRSQVGVVCLDAGELRVPILQVLEWTTVVRFRMEEKGLSGPCGRRDRAVSEMRSNMRAFPAPVPDTTAMLIIVN
jgi:hypothetical protein